MRLPLTIALCTFAAACGREPAQAPPIAPTAEVPSSTAAADISPFAAQSYVDNIRFAPGARSAATTQFAYNANSVTLGRPLTIGMDVRDAPAGTAVKVIWYGPKGRMNAVTKHVTAAGETLEFSTGETSAWGTGSGRAEIWVGDEKIGDADFEIVPVR